MQVKTLSAVVLISFACVAQAVTVSVDAVRQRYPWNGLVDIDYTISYGTDEEPLDIANDRLEVFAVNNETHPATTNAALTLNPAPVPTSAGSHRITWNANADGVDYVSDDVTIRLVARRYAPKYMVVNLTQLNAEGKYDVTYLDGEPVGGFNKEKYKGDNIVFRLIPPGSYVAGSPTTEPGRDKGSKENQFKVTISRPFYLGIFEVTQKQHQLVTGNNPASSKGDYRPVENIKYDALHGNGTFIKLMGDKTGLPFELPTECQWEYACRAGKTTPFHNGVECANVNALAEQMNKLGRYSGNLSVGDYPSAHTTVGSFVPNAWGLYDMHGNVSEYCLGWHADDFSSLGQRVDPVGPNSGTYHPQRGGDYTVEAKYCRAARKITYTNWGYQPLPQAGFRLACPAP